MVSDVCFFYSTHTPWVYLGYQDLCHLLQVKGMLALPLGGLRGTQTDRYLREIKVGPGVGEVPGKGVRDSEACGSLGRLYQEVMLQLKRKYEEVDPRQAR